jgi:hypothetical protein
MQELVEAYGDDPVAVLQNGMLGVARKRKLNKLKDKEAKRAKVAKLVTAWEAAIVGKKTDMINWLLKKLD